MRRWARLRLPGLLSMIALICCGPASGQAVPNLIRNPSFESDADNSGGADQWLFTAANEAQATWTRLSPWRPRPFAHK